MKPRSKIERAMLALAEKLPPITERQRQYAYAHCFGKRAIVKPRKREVRCLGCGQTAVYDKTFIDSFLRTEEYDCPYCGRTLAAERNSPTTCCNEKRWFTVITTFRGHQVARTWEVTRDNDPAERFARYGINEIFQTWLTADGREVITGRQLHRSINSTTWDFDKPLGIRHHNGGAAGYYQMEDIYDISGNYLYPDVRVTPLVRRNGWDRRLLRFANAISMTDAMRWLLTVPTAEMLVKTGQDDLFLHMVRRGLHELPLLHAVRIANRNGYIVDDAQMWLDMLEMSHALGKDTHSPKVVCPANLKTAHDALLAPMRRLHEKQRLARKVEDAKEWKARYKADKAPYFGICFGNDDIVVTVMQSVAEIAEEGAAMHHCVFEADYYKKRDSLILSARNRSDGSRLETIEVSLKTFKVLQSRARCNGKTEQHDEILRLLETNMGQIRNATAV